MRILLLGDYSNVHATLARITPGPVVTMFEVRPAPGVKATRITNLANDLAMSLKAVAVRMQAPVPGTDTVGVEVPNEKRSTVHFREIIENEIGEELFYLAAIASAFDISLYDILLRERKKLEILGKFSLK